jgi:hypothetical protein
MFEQGDDINMDMAAPPPPAEQSNRTFIIAAGILAGVVLLSIICMAVYALVYLPQQKAGQSSVQATIEAQNLMVQQAMTMTMQAGALNTQIAIASAQPTQTLTPEVIVPTNTPLMAVASNTPMVVDAAMTATWSALNTQVAVGLKTPTATPGGAMPASGFADEVGLPGLVVMSVALVVVILLARRLRSAPTA